VTFILLVKNETKVLQTLLSRSQKFYVEGYSNEFIAEALGVGGEEGYLVAMQSGGNLEEARKLSLAGNSSRLADFVLDSFLNFKKTTELAKTLMRAEEFKEDIKEMLAFFAGVAEMGIRIQAGKQIELSKSITKRVQEIASVWNYLGLVGIIEASITALKMIESYVQTSNVLDQFFLKILEVRRKCKI